MTTYKFDGKSLTLKTFEEFCKELFKLKPKPPKHEPTLRDIAFNKVYFKMTDDERNVYTLYQYSGMYIRRTNTILMGSDAMTRYLNFQDEMIDKYK